MRFALIGSGSKGNGTLIEHGQTRILVDCGFSLRESEARLQRLGCEPASLNAIVVTHEHGDHIRGVGLLARRYGVPVWATRGTVNGTQPGKVPRLNLFDVHQPLAIGDLELQPFPVPHDAREPCQFLFRDGDRSLGLLTDTGCSTPHIHSRLSDCDALILECNHDPQMLAEGPYPPALKQRVGGDRGHLSNAQAAQILTEIDTGGLHYLVAAHLSDKNNTPALAQDALSGALGCKPVEIEVACQEQGTDWRDV
ncbi:MBL fold metallo-hydrolase [Thiohalophilus sp.]|uniref:MBL fold metallo-hydrolase n=1 Tax=Thiohalophilus sp. TaxID=3028392 RepID=UPI003975CABC